MNPKIGVVDVGGGCRGVYAAGVLDYCMHMGIRFDLGIGVSAGSANIASSISDRSGSQTIRTEFYVPSLFCLHSIHSYVKKQDVKFMVGKL